MLQRNRCNFQGMEHYSLQNINTNNCLKHKHGGCLGIVVLEPAADMRHTYTSYIIIHNKYQHPNMVILWREPRTRCPDYRGEITVPRLDTSTSLILVSTSLNIKSPNMSVLNNKVS